jgi:hypothetical protein
MMSNGEWPLPLHSWEPGEALQLRFAVTHR